MIETSIGAVAYINPSSVGNNYSYKEIDYIDISSVGSGVLTGTTHYHISDAPSRAKRLVEAGKILDIKVTDHIIITKNGYFSFKEKGLI